MALGSDEAMSEDSDKEPDKVNHAEHISSLGRSPSTNNDDGTNDDTDNYDMLSFLEDDDAAVILQELSSNFAISARTPPSRGSAKLMSSFVIRSASRGRGTPSSPRSVLRDCVTKALLDASRKTTVDQPQFKRLLSAKRNHINSLSNDIIGLQRKIKELEEQNRLLVRISKRQEMALKKYHDMETQLPHVLEMHRVEIKSLQDKLRKAIEAHKKDTETLKKYDARILKQNCELTHLRSLTQRKNLQERLVLTKKLESTEKNLQEKGTENMELNRRLLVLQKSLTQQVSAEADRHKVTSRKLSKLQTDHEKTLEKLKACERELGSLQHYRSRASRCLSSAYSSTTNISTSTETPASLSLSSGGKLSRKKTSRRLKPSSQPVGPSSKSPDRPTTATIRKASNDYLPPDAAGTSTAILDLSAVQSGWTSDCHFNGTRVSTDAEASSAERLGSGILPPLGGDFTGRKKYSSSSDNLSSPEDSSMGTHSKSHDFQTSGAIDESISRKTTIQSSWSDDTHEGDFPLSRGNSPAGINPLAHDDKEVGSEEDFFTQGICPPERCFSLIENYPPKARGKLQNGPGTDPHCPSSDSSGQGTPSPLREIETITCNTPIETPVLSKLRGIEGLTHSRGTSAARRHSIKRRNSALMSVGEFRAFSALSIEDRESSYTQTDPLN